MARVEWEMQQAEGPGRKQAKGAILVRLAEGQTLQDAKRSVTPERWEPVWDEQRPLGDADGKTLVVPVRPRLEAHLHGNARNPAPFVVWYGTSTKQGRADAESRLPEWTFLWESKVAGAVGGWVVRLQRKL